MNRLIWAGWCTLPLAWLLVLGCVLQVFGQLGAPLYEEGYDVYQTCRCIKSLWENHSYYWTPQLGAPGVANHAGFPLTFVLHLPLLWVVSLFSDNVYLHYNLLFFLGCLGCCASAYWSLLRLEITPLAAWCMAVAYGFAPNHLARYQHLSISYAVAAPAVIWICVRLLRGQGIGRAGWVWLLVAALSGVYTAYFTVWLLVIATLFGRRWTGFGGAALVCGVLGLLLLPNWLFQDSDAALLPTRRPQDVVNYALTLDRLVLPLNPRPQHVLASWAQQYYATYPSAAGVTESAYIGLPACLGLLLLIWRGPREFLGLAGFLLLFASASGLAPLLAATLGTGIRCYNRVSFFLAFLGFYGLARATPAWTAPLWLALALGDSLLATPPWKPTHESVAACRAFVQTLEKQLPSGSALWQVPRIPYPETAQLHREGEYAWARLYAVSRTLRWSWGDMKNTWPDEIKRHCAELPWPAQLEVLRQSGFSGIVLLRTALPDQGRGLESGWQQLGLKPAVESSDHQYVFYPLLPLARPVSLEEAMARQMWGPPPWSLPVNRTVGILLRSGWHEPEPEGTWSASRRALLRLPAGTGWSRVRLVFTPFIADQPQRLTLRRGRSLLGQWEYRTQRPETLELEMELPCLLEVGVSQLNSPGRHDPRRLGVMLHRLEISPVRKGAAASPGPASTALRGAENRSVASDLCR